MSHNRKKHINKHHLKPKSRHGDSRGSNMLYIDIEKHCWLHKIFGNLTLCEIIILLIRVAKAKHYENIEPKVKLFYKYLS